MVPSTFSKAARGYHHRNETNCWSISSTLIKRYIFSEADSKVKQVIISSTLHIGALSKGKLLVCKDIMYLPTPTRIPSIP